MTWPKPPYVGDAWEYAIFPNLPDGWILVSTIGNDVFAKRQTHYRDLPPMPPSWTLRIDLINNEIVRRYEAWK